MLKLLSEAHKVLSTVFDKSPQSHSRSRNPRSATKDGFSSSTLHREDPVETYKHDRFKRYWYAPLARQSWFYLHQIDVKAVSDLISQNINLCTLEVL